MTWRANETDAGLPGGSSATYTRLPPQPCAKFRPRPIGASPAAVFEVRGLYEMEAVFDESYVFIDLPEAQRLFRMPGRVTGIDVRLADLDQAPAVQTRRPSSIPERDVLLHEIPTRLQLVGVAHQQPGLHGRSSGRPTFQMVSPCQ